MLLSRAASKAGRRGDLARRLASALAPACFTAFELTLLFARLFLCSCPCPPPTPLWVL